MAIKSPWGRSRNLGNLRVPPGTYGAGATLILGAAKASCPPQTLIPAAQSLRHLAPELPQEQPAYPSSEDYKVIFPPPETDGSAALRAAQEFNSTASTRLSSQQVLNLSDALCNDVQHGSAQTNLRAYLGRADLDSLDAVNTLVSLTINRCSLPPAETEAVTGRLNDFLVANQHLAELPPFLVNPTWNCGTTPQEAKLNWVVAGANPITGYELYHLNADGSTTSYHVRTAIYRGVTTTTVPNLAPAIHDFALRATDDQGNHSAWVAIRADQRICHAFSNTTR
ncbi:hypothetical protein ACFVYD_28660 [Streptomyces sp. NPDC058301]|uniref:hypothetical protein n=1 Tax=Streptomyces sp. NPDC058301 TaxID=3346436 RepID=UPI0036E33923